MSPQSEPNCCSQGKIENIENEVRQRYAAGAQAAEAELCCPTQYDSTYLKIIPAEIIEKDYGCGDPSVHVREGEVAVDLGSGAGKICFILAQKVGAQGRVIGVDFNDPMLALARKYQDEIANALGYANTRFVKGRIQDLALDLEKANHWLQTRPIDSVEAMAAYEAECDRLRLEEPLIADNSVDVVVSNCVLNLVRPQDKQQLFKEIHRVLRRGGRAVISDIVCDETPPDSIRNDPKLWSGCIAGAFREDEFLRMFEEAGFYGIEVLDYQVEPWQVIEGIEFRSYTLQAFKGKEGECLDRNQAVIYKGPWRCVFDDDNHKISRGERMAVCDKTFKLYTDANGPFAGQFIPVEPRQTVPLKEAPAFDCRRTHLRDPRETKGLEYSETREARADCCSGPESCC